MNEGRKIHSKTMKGHDDYLFQETGALPLPDLTSLLPLNYMSRTVSIATIAVVTTAGSLPIFFIAKVTTTPTATTLSLSLMVVPLPLQPAPLLPLDYMSQTLSIGTVAKITTTYTATATTIGTASITANTIINICHC